MSELPICMLCQERDADKLNSHIIPHFLIKSMVNEPGKKGRDNEISFEIGSTVKTYIGRNIGPEKIHEVMGKELSDEDLKSNIDPYIRDNILCTSCEKRLSIIETAYSSAISRIEGDFFVKEISVQLSMLLWVSIIWRCSVASFSSEFKLPQDIEEKLRVILNDHLINSDKELKKLTLIDSLKDFKYLLFRFPPKESTTKNFIYLLPYKADHPICFLLNQHILIFSLENHDSFVFFGTEELIQNKIWNFYDGESEYSYRAKESFEKEINSKLVQKKKEVFLMQLKNYITQEYLKHYKKNPTVNIVEEIVQSIIHSPVPPGEKYTQFNIDKVIDHFFENS